MLHFLLAIPATVLYGCLFLIVVAIAVGIWSCLQTGRIQAQVRVLRDTFNPVGDAQESQVRDGLTLAKLDDIRSRCETLADAPREWWTVLDSHIEEYTSPEDVEGWFLIEKPRYILPYEIVIGKNFHSGFFSAFPGLLTGAGLSLTFIAILLALYGVHYDKANTADPVSGIDTLINGLSGQVSQLHCGSFAQHFVHTV